MLLQAMDEFSVPPESALMVGDREADKGAAFHAKVPFVRVHQTLEEIEHRQYSSLQDLVDNVLLKL